MIELEKIELFDGTMRFSPLLLLLDLILLFQLFYSWYKFYKKTGLKLNYWHLFIFKLFFFNVFLLYPFNASMQNKITVHYLVKTIDKWMDTAYLVTITGYICFLLGGYIYTKLLSSKLKNNNFFSIENFVTNNIRSNKTTYIMTLISVGLIMFLISTTIKSGNVFNPRGFFLADSEIRPIYNLTTSLYPISVIYMGLRFFQYNRTTDKIIFVILIIFSIFLGVRSAMLEPIVILFFFYYLKNSSKISFISIFIAIGSVIFVALAISAMRADGTVSNKFQEIVYGNHFSDTRDFAWLLSFFDFNWLEGKTYFAGMLTFIPRKYSEFREQWVWGIYAAKLVGITDPLFPGHRPGFFGEIFMNFSLPGVIFLGLFSGITIKHIHTKILNEYYSGKDVIKMYSYTILSILVMSISISAVFVTLYSYIGITIFLTFVRQVIDLVNYKVEKIL